MNSKASDNSATVVYSQQTLPRQPYPKTMRSGSVARHRKVERPKGWSTLVATISTVMMTLDITIILVALPAMAEDLQLTLSGGQWIINAYSLAFASLLLSAGSMSDIVGRRTLFLAGHVLFLAASLACALSTTEAWLITARAVQGAGGALVFGTSIPLLSDAFLPSEKEQRTRAITLLMACAAASSALGPLVGGFLVEYGTWEWIFYINIPIGIFVICTTLFFVPDIHKETALGSFASQEDTASQTKALGSAPTPNGAQNGASQSENTPLPPLDPVIMVVAAAMLFALNYGIIAGPDDGWTHWRVLVSFGISAILASFIIVNQSAKGEAAMIDIGLFSIPSFTTVTFASFAARLFSFGMMPFLVLWLAGQVGLNALQIGYVSTAMAVPIVLFAGVALILGRHMRLGFVQAIGMLIVAGGLLLGLIIDSQSSWTALIPAYIVIGCGTGIMMPHLMDLAVSVVPATRTGTASGIANTALPLGTSFGVAIYGAYLSHVIDTDLAAAPQKVRDAAEAGQFGLIEQVSPPLAEMARISFVDALHGIFLFAAAIAVVGALACAIFIKETHQVTANKS